MAAFDRGSATRPRDIPNRKRCPAPLAGRESTRKALDPFLLTRQALPSLPQHAGGATGTHGLYDSLASSSDSASRRSAVMVLRAPATLGRNSQGKLNSLDMQYLGTGTATTPRPQRRCFTWNNARAPGVSLHSANGERGAAVA